MNILITAGGTLGHIMPGLILAKELSKKHSVIYIASLKDEKYDVIKKVAQKAVVIFNIPSL